ncbi:MAG: DUF5018 domain-containing protein [Fibrobacteres bacterium]|nr:DUF5018 domain-containing protein [Fibrobacterota bacterium]
MTKSLAFCLMLAMAILPTGCQDPIAPDADPNPVDTSPWQPSTAKSFKTFSFKELPDSCKIDESRNTVSIKVPYGTRVDSLTPVFTQTGVSCVPASGVAMDFTRPVVYTLTSESKTTRAYTVSVLVTPMTPKAITSFSFPKTRSVGIIDTTHHTIAIDIPDSVDARALKPTIAHSGKSISPDTSAAQDFSKPIQYTVTATDGREQAYTVNARILKASRDVKINFASPLDRAEVGDSAIVAIVVSSTYQIASASVRAGNTTIPLSYGTYTDRGYSQKSWMGTFSLLAFPRGPLEFFATATDVFGNVSQAALSVNVDRKSSLTVLSPLEGDVANPTILVRAFASDDDPSSKTTLRVSFSGGGEVATGKDSISQTIDLSSVVGQSIQLVVSAFDSKSQQTSVSRTVFVEPSRKYLLRAKVPGAIWDASGTRILFVDRTGKVPVLKILDTASRIALTLDSTADVLGNNGFLAPNGAIYTKTLRSTASGQIFYGLFEWKNGHISKISDLSNLPSFRVTGDWAIYHDANGLFRRDLSNGTSTLIASNASSGENSIAFNGYVAYSSTPNNDVYLWDGNSSKMLIPHSSRNLASPVTDGINTVFLRRSSTNSGDELVLFDGTAETKLADSSTNPSTFPMGYAIAGGWVAFLKKDPFKTEQVWRRVRGTEEQVTFFAANSRIQLLQTDGTVVILCNQKRYAARPGSTPVEIGSTLGKPLDRAGKLLLTIGGTLFEVAP